MGVLREEGLSLGSQGRREFLCLLFLFPDRVARVPHFTDGKVAPPKFVVNRGSAGLRAGFPACSVAAAFPFSHLAHCGEGPGQKGAAQKRQAMTAGGPGPTLASEEEMGRAVLWRELSCNEDMGRVVAGGGQGVQTPTLPPSHLRPQIFAHGGPSW